MKYVCPKCHTTVESNKELEYCVCGGKYQPNVSDLLDSLGLSDVFREPLKK